MTKVVYNACYGGFGLSGAAKARYRELAGHDYDEWEGARHDPLLVQVVEEMGRGANGECSRLKIASIPDGSKYRIDEYDGQESVETPDSYEWVQT